MSMVVRTNTMSINAYRQVGMNHTAVAKSLEKLSSGFRINRAGDDSSGLAISEKMKAQIHGLEQASANAQDGIALLQTAEGALTEVHSMLNRMVELATQSANGIQNNVDRGAIQTEVDSLKTEITRISQSTNFNGINLLDGSLGSSTSQVPPSIGTAGAAGVSGAANNGLAANTIDFKIFGDAGIQITIQTGVSAAKNMSAAWSGSSLAVTLQANAATTFNQSDLDTAIASASGTAPSVIKVTLNKDITVTGATSVGSSVTVSTQNPAYATATDPTTGVTVTAIEVGTQANFDTLNFAIGTVPHPSGTATVDVDGNTTVYLDTATLYSASEINAILSDASSEMRVSFDGTRKHGAAAPDTFSSGYMLFGGAGLPDGTGLPIGPGSSSTGGLTLQVGDTNDSFNKVVVSIGDLSAKGLGIGDLDISSQDAAGAAIQTIKDAINTVSTSRGTLGALQNRLEYAINNLDTTAENITSANSRISDTDMAKEMMNYTKMNILTQAAQAMLAQANQNPQSILQLLQ